MGAGGGNGRGGSQDGRVVFSEVGVYLWDRGQGSAGLEMRFELAAKVRREALPLEGARAPFS